MADTEQKADDGGPGEKEANKAPSPKPDTQDSNDVSPPLITVSKGLNILHLSMEVLKMKTYL